MCKRCIIKGRAVGKSTELGAEGLKRSFKIASDHDRCVAIFGDDYKPFGVAKLQLTDEQARLIRTGKFGGVSMGVGMSVANLEGIKKLELSSDDVVKVEEVDVQYERAVPVDLIELTEITECDDEDS